MSDVFEDYAMSKFASQADRASAMANELAKLRAENDTLAATIQQLRDGISTCIAYKRKPSKELLRVGYNTAAILAERDARTLMMAADNLNLTGDVDEFTYIACRLELRAMADELAKAQNG